MMFLQFTALQPTGCILTGHTILSVLIPLHRAREIERDNISTSTTTSTSTSTSTGN